MLSRKFAVCVVVVAFVFALPLQSGEMFDINNYIDPLDTSLAQSVLSGLADVIKGDKQLLGFESSQKSLFLIKGSNPIRREAGTPWITVEADAGLGGLAMYLNQGGSYVEAAHGRPLFPIHITSLPANATRYIEYDIDTATMAVSPWMITQFHTLPDTDLEAIYTRVLTKIAAVCQTTKSEDLQSKLVELVGDFTELLAVGGTLLCITCTVVLAIGLPMGFNLFFGHLVELYCDAHQISPTDCFDLVLGVVLVSNLFLPLWALLIVKVCKLQTCTQALVRDLPLPKLF